MSLELSVDLRRLREHAAVLQAEIQEAGLLETLLAMDYQAKMETLDPGAEVSRRLMADMGKAKNAVVRRVELLNATEEKLSKLQAEIQQNISSASRALSVLDSCFR